MKKNALLLVVVLLGLSTSAAFAKIWRVNNNNGVTADFKTLQEAHDGAASGDTIHLEGSATSYSNLTSTKKLVVIGPGYYLDQNPNTQAHSISAQVGAITYNSGSEGSEIMGLDVSSVTIFSNNITIKRNKFITSINGEITDWATGVILLYYQSNNTSIPVSNILISQNYGVRIQSSYASTGVLITNNHIATNAFEGEASNGDALTLSSGTVALIQNNIFRRGKVTAYNSTLTNNIMFTGTMEGTGNMMSNNIGNSTQFGTANGNQSNVDMSTVFVGPGAGISTDGQWKLAVGSPALGAGYGSTTTNPVDAGMYSNQTPYVLSGIPPVPAIYFLEAQPVGSSTDPIDVTVKVKSNN
ncbi:hypothetical protein ACFSRY_15265 [Pontibacter locisalis]|uniref:Right handed beta helix domain-containing protein n=1 Tax=Pontibacter locisalis TaxID=1719035 RepID=A0ABW5IQI5_9BACT